MLFWIAFNICLIEGHLLTAFTDRLGKVLSSGLIGRWTCVIVLRSNFFTEAGHVLNPWRLILSKPKKTSDRLVRRNR